MAVFVARQPVLTPASEVFGYELLFRSGLENSYTGTDPDESTLDVIANTFMAIGFEELTDGCRAFINFSRALLVEQVPTLLPKDRVVVEILEDIEPDQEVIDACDELKKKGYFLAMDDAVLQDVSNPLVAYVDMLKVDFMQCSLEARKGLIDKLRQTDLSLLAEKVETREEFDQSVQWGYHYFQGYYFAKPEVRSASAMAGNQMAYLRVLNELNQPGLDLDDLEGLIRQDVTLTYKLLKFINSAWFSFRQEIGSIKHALVLLGDAEIRRWFSLLVIRHMAPHKPRELMRQSMIRATAMETLAPRLDANLPKEDVFMAGLFSVIDGLTDTPMEELLDGLPLRQPVVDALLGRPGSLHSLLSLAIAYEQADWDAVARITQRHDLVETDVAETFLETQKWASKAMRTL